MGEVTTVRLRDEPVSVRVKLAGLWTAALVIFAYVDLFMFYRTDARAAIEAGEVAGFSIGQGFLVGTTAYVALPSLMVFATLALPPRPNRVLQLTLSVLYALTIVASAVGEWWYYLGASALEVVLLGGIAYYAWTWPRISA